MKKTRKIITLAVLVLTIAVLAVGGFMLPSANNTNTIPLASATIETISPLIPTPFGVERPITSLAIDRHNVFLGAWWGGTGQTNFAVYNKQSQTFTHNIDPNFIGSVRDIQSIVQDQTHVYMGGGTNFARWCKTTHTMSSLIPTNMGGSVHRLAICDDFVYIISQTYGRMGIFSKDAGAVTRLIAFNVPIGWRDIAINDTYVFIAGGNSFVRFNRITQVMSVPKNLPSGSDAQSITACNEFVYIGSSGNLIIYNISSGVFETIPTGISNIGVISAIAMNDNFIYLGGQGYIAVFNKVTRTMTETPPINFAGHIGAINSMALYGSNLFLSGWEGNFARAIIEEELDETVNYVTVSFRDRNGNTVAYVRIARDSILSINQIPAAPIVQGFEFLYWTNASGIRVNSLISQDTVLWASYRLVSGGNITDPPNETENEEDSDSNTWLIVFSVIGGLVVVVGVGILIERVVSKFKKKDSHDNYDDYYDYNYDDEGRW